MSEYVLTVTTTGSAAQKGLPVTLRYRTRGNWYRDDAEADGGATFELIVKPDPTSGAGADKPRWRVQGAVRKPAWPL